MSFYELSSLLLLLVLLSSALISDEATAHPIYHRHFNAIYNFGDSLSDTGNLVRESPIAAALLLRFPYGISINKPTGRYSDGLLLIDYFALNFGFPLLPPYLDKNANFAEGVNFAVSGATALEASFLRSENIVNPFTNNSLGIQLDWFRQHKTLLCSRSSERKCKRLLGRSLFFLGEIGANDFTFASRSSKSVQELKDRYIPLVVAKITSVAEELIKAGARYLIIPGNPPFGCTPSALDMVNTTDPRAYDENGCLVISNEFARYYNLQLRNAIIKLRNRHRCVRTLYADYYNAYLNLYKKAHMYGFDRGTFTRSCCGVGGRYNFDLNRLCGTPEATVCPNPSRYVSWDGIHPTQQAYKKMTMEFIYGGLINDGVHI